MADKTKKMSAVAAIINPITELRPDKNDWRVLLHYADTRNQTLTLDQRSLSSSQQGTVRNWVTEDPKELKPPSLANPSTLVALNVDDYVHVYGVLDDSKGTIAMVSPVFQSLRAKSTTGIIAGSTDKSSAWIYYESSGPNGAYIAMKEVSGLADGDPDSGCQDVNSGTWIDAVTDTGKVNWIAYQKKNGIVAVLNQNKGNPTEVKADKTRFLANTPIGVTFISKKFYPAEHKFPKSSSPRGQLFVYWLDGNNRLMRAIADISTNSDFPAFSDPEPVGRSAQYVAPYAQISVVPNKADKKNLIYTMMQTPSNEVKISVIVDEWYQKEEEE